MRHLLFSTALLAASAFAMPAHASQDAPRVDRAAEETVPAFLSSTFTGMRVYSISPDSTLSLNPVNPDVVTAPGRARWSRSDAFMSDRNDMENIGEVADIVITHDGEIQGILVRFGGFLGMGSRTVLLTTNHLNFVSRSSADNAAENFFVVMSLTKDELEALPEWDAQQLQTGFSLTGGEIYRDGNAQPRTVMSPSSWDNREAAQQTGVFSGGYVLLARNQWSRDRLVGAQVYADNGDRVGTVSDVTMNGNNAVAGLIVDIGGFLGMGGHTVRISADQAEVGWNEGKEDTRINLPMTRSQLEALPAYTR